MKLYSLKDLINAVRTQNVAYTCNRSNVFNRGQHLLRPEYNCKIPYNFRKHDLKWNSYSRFFVTFIYKYYDWFHKIRNKEFHIFILIKRNKFHNNS